MGGSNRLVGSNPTLSAGPRLRRTANPLGYDRLDVRGWSTPCGPGGNLGAPDRRAARRPGHNRGVATVRAGELQRPEPIPELQRPTSTTTSCAATSRPSRSTPTPGRAGRHRSATIRSAAATSATSVPLGAGRAFTITVRQGGGPGALPLLRALPAQRLPRLHLHPPAARCRRSSSRWTRQSFHQRYAMIFDNHGVPVWWYHAAAHGPEGAPERDRAVVRSLVRQVGDPPPRRQPRPHPRSGRPTGQRPRPAVPAERGLPGRRLRQRRATSTRAPTAAPATPTSPTPSYRR